MLVAPIVSSLRIELVRVKCARTGSAHQAVRDTTPSSEQSADQRTCSGGEADIDHVPVASIEARAISGVAGSRVAGCASIRPGSTRSLVSPVPRTAGIGLDRQRQADSKYEEHHC